ncbi:MAG: hypothetical protein NVS1B11_30010 [Terriglobales bacterium]
MPDKTLIIDQLRRAFHGDAWHGPAVLEILASIDAATAASHPVLQAHSIWELVLHIEAWERAAVKRFEGEAVELEGDHNFPAIVEASDSAWSSAIEKFRGTHEQLLHTISAVKDSRLAEQVPGGNYHFEFMLHGLAQHALYHAGQMAILKIAAET